MTRQLVLLVGGTLGLWLLAAAPAWLLGGEQALLETAAAALLCLLPMVATMVWAHHSFGGSPEQLLAAGLGGSGARMLVVLGGGIALSRSVEALSRPAFLLWVVVFYLATLTLEIVLIVRRQNAAAPAASSPAEQPRP